MIKKLIVILALGLSVAFPQNNDDDDYEPVYRAPAFDAQFGGGGGYYGGVFFTDLSKINSTFAGFGTPDLTSGFYSSGGGGFVYIGAIKNLRVGGLGMSARTSSRGSSNGFDKEISYSNSFGGVTVEYSFPFIRDWALSIGGIIGIGGQTIEVSRHFGAMDWDKDVAALHDDVGGAFLSYSRKYSNTYMTLAPTLNADFLLHPFISFRVGVGYAFNMFGDTWKADNNVTLNNFPARDINGNTFFLQFGVLAGLFFY
ncbi:MAG: hypothetical protein LC102_06000 [Ignavibacteriales bacterium]|nr:MAG: hypothetical protein F9K26_08850 [Ignavibacteriaceae bacterium]MBW7874187.1 hypothetical protein [Ignavibacteria bacterium]MCZ2142962.1 hypothetical protein [Ignavibacteriales bacterium]MBV6444486.1 hypothetical protein [Ignavibacteriaceae bacterium]MBZ0197873.1 hypothetical protein [Ignavibacteriaceae bacterium]